MGQKRVSLLFFLLSCCFFFFFPKSSIKKRTKFRTKKLPKKRKKERKKENVRAAAARFSARQPLVRRQHPVVDHRRGVTSAVRGRDERRDPNRACLRGRLLSLRWSFFFFIPRVVSLFWRTQSALCRKERRHDGDQNRDCADSFDDKKNDDDGFAHPIVSPKEARDATSPDHPLSLSRRETTTTT